jgi:RNA polymerase sigma-70 factor (ECF subfamily)
MEEPVADEELMLRYAHGDATAFDELYARHRGGAFRYLLRHLGSRAQAEELFQDLWMNLIGARERYRVEAKFTTWLYTMAHNRVIDFYRRQRPLELVSLDAGDEQDDPPPQVAASPACEPHRAVEARQQAARLLRLVDALPATQREAFLLQQEGDLSLEQIAEVTGVDRETVKSRLRYAMDKLRRGMGERL